jgi:type I restriction enzyme M protein
VQITAGLDAEKVQTFTDSLAKLHNARTAFDTDAKGLLANISTFEIKIGKNQLVTNDQQHLARNAFDPIAAQTKGLIKHVDLLYKLASSAAMNATDLTGAEAVAKAYNRRATGKLIKQLDESRRAAVEQLKHATYYYRHIVWLQDRFPEAKMQPVAGLVKVVTQKDIEAADWSLTPGRYVGVAPTEMDENFDFEQAITDIHEELAGLNAEAVDLATMIQANLEVLGL